MKPLKTCHFFKQICLIKIHILNVILLCIYLRTLNQSRTAIKIIEWLPKLGVERLVYVSCNSATLARDTEKLIDIGYQLETAGVMDMFKINHFVTLIKFQ
jgi:hypothetical protein